MQMNSTILRDVRIEGAVGGAVGRPPRRANALSFMYANELNMQRTHKRAGVEARAPRAIREESLELLPQQTLTSQVHPHEPTWGPNVILLALRPQLELRRQRPHDQHHHGDTNETDASGQPYEHKDITGIPPLVIRPSRTHQKDAAAGDGENTAVDEHRRQTLVLLELQGAVAREHERTVNVAECARAVAGADAGAAIRIGLAEVAAALLAVLAEVVPRADALPEEPVARRVVLARAAPAVEVGAEQDEGQRGQLRAKNAAQLTDDPEWAATDPEWAAT